MTLSSSLFKLLMFALLCIPIASGLITNYNSSLNGQREHEDIDGGIYQNFKETHGDLLSEQESPPPRL